MNTLDLIIAKAEQKKDDKLLVKKYKSKTIGGVLTLRKPPLTKISSLIDAIGEETSSYEQMRYNAGLVYEACPDIKGNYQKLKEVYEVADPYDLVIKMFDDNIAELRDIAQTVFEFYGFDLIDDLKN